jgi:hypothetical protein
MTATTPHLSQGLRALNRIGAVSVPRAMMAL